MAQRVQQQGKIMSDSGPLQQWLLRLTAIFFTVVSLQLSADEYSAGWGPSVGTVLPPIAAVDQAGVEHHLASLSGDHGLLLFLSRSADW